jgi:hypothetical protein
MESRKMLRKLARKERHHCPRLTEVLPLLSNDNEHVLAFKLVGAYLDAGINDPEVLKSVLAKTVPTFGFFERVFNIFHGQSEEYVDLLVCLPSLLQQVYPQALGFMAKLVDSQPGSKQKGDKKEKKTKKKRSQEKGNSGGGHEKSVVNDGADPIFDSQSLFECFRRGKEYPCLFGDPSDLDSFDELFRILTKLPREEVSNFDGLLEGWLERVCIFHPQQGQESKWRARVMSYCHIWRVIFFELRFTPRLEILSKHFDILAELLNMHYEGKAEALDL